MARTLTDQEWLDHHQEAADNFNFRCETHQPWGQLDTVLQWCKDYCKEEWRWQMVHVSTQTLDGEYVFYFRDGQDATAFSLRWT